MKTEIEMVAVEREILLALLDNVDEAMKMLELVPDLSHFADKAYSSLHLIWRRLYSLLGEETESYGET